MSKQGVYDFYRDRILSCPLYGLTAGHELLRLILRCAMSDSLLTREEFNSIIIYADKAHIKMMEDNYNAGWQDQ